MKIKMNDHRGLGINESIVIKIIFMLITAIIIYCLNSCVQKTPLNLSQESDDPIHIAYWLAKSDYHYPMGKDMIRGIEMAIDDIGGKIKGHRIKLIGYDSRCSSAGGETAARKIANNPRIIAAIGPTCTKAAEKGVPILWEKSIPTISPSNSSPMLTDPNREAGFDGYLRTHFNDKYQGIVAAQFAYHKLGVKRAATINDGSLYAMFHQKTFSEEFKKLGGVITAREKIRPDSKNMNAVLKKIASGNPDFLYFPVFIKQAGYITRQIRSVEGIQNIRLMSSDGSYSTSLLSIAGKNCVGMYFTAPDLSKFKSEHDNSLLKFKHRYGVRPNTPFHAYSYDAAKILFNAIDRVAVQSSDNKLSIDRNKLNAELHETKNHQGLTGYIHCDKYGDCGVPRISIFKIEKSNYMDKELPVTAHWKSFIDGCVFNFLQ